MASDRISRRTVSSFFDNPRQVSERTGHVRGEMEILEEREARECEADNRAREKAEKKKRIFDFIRSHPGRTLNEIRQSLGSVSGVKEWEADGLLVRRQGRYYLAD
jgi:hypothetical protein